MDNFDLYLNDYMIAAFNEMKKYCKENGLDFSDGMIFTEDGKEGVYKENYYLRDNLQIPYITKELAKPKVQDAIIEFMGKFIDDHSTQLSTSGPVHIFTFSDKEVSVLYNLFNIDSDKLLSLYDETIKETYYGNISKFITGWIKHAPHKLLITAILIEALQKGYEDIVTCCEYMWAFTEYPIVYRMFWKVGVKEDVMNYTIEHLGNKFIVKKTSNLQELLKYHATASVDSFKDRLISGVDNVYIDFMQRMRNQIKNGFKNISVAYYANEKNNSTQHSKDAKFDDGSLADQEGYNTNINQIVENTINKFMINSINNSMAKITADGAKVDKDNLIGFINQIWASKDNKLSKLIEDIITAYFSKNPTDTSVGSGEFINFGLALYRSIGTSKDPIYQEIKSIINYWMDDIINIKQYYQREGTQIAYARAIFNYIIFMINYYN